MEKYLYFRGEATLANDDAIGDSVMYPASALIGMYPTGDAELTINFKNVQRPEGHGNSLVLDNAANLPLVDKVVLVIGTNKAKEAMQDIATALNDPTVKDGGFVVIADDVTSEYVSSHISAATITHNAAYVNA